MNMSTSNSQTQQPARHHFIVEEVLAATQTQCSDAQKRQYAKQFLDRAFPLLTGSHQDVCSYVVYYQHLLAFFADGSHSGLATPCQFVAFNGSKNAPCAIVLLDNAELQAGHVELSFDCHCTLGTSDAGHLLDIQIETPLSLVIPQTGTNTAARHWTSLINARQQGHNPQQEKLFTAKDGSEYRLQTEVVL